MYNISDLIHGTLLSSKNIFLSASNRQKNKNTQAVAENNILIKVECNITSLM